MGELSIDKPYDKTDPAGLHVTFIWSWDAISLKLSNIKLISNYLTVVNCVNLFDGWNHPYEPDGK